MQECVVETDHVHEGTGADFSELHKSEPRRTGGEGPGGSLPAKKLFGSDHRARAPRGAGRDDCVPPAPGADYLLWDQQRGAATRPGRASRPSVGGVPAPDLPQLLDEVGRARGDNPEAPVPSAEDRLEESADVQQRERDDSVPAPYV